MNVGARFGPYEVIGKLGEGETGGVYLARDTRLDRSVALKPLLLPVARDRGSLVRFESEAKQLASLNHPNVAQIYGLEDDGLARAVVMELVEGPTLAHRITQGPLPLEEVLAIAGQIASALEAAHAHGIIHRDLKPANIKLGVHGSVKVLDFGLAKLAEPVPGSGRASVLTPPDQTREGFILGTPGYMSPEQVRGESVDTRADLWALGCVMYEMLTGKRAFKGASLVDDISAVLTRDPDWNALPEQTPASVRRMLQHCLARDMTQRVRHAGDVRLELQNTAGNRSADEGPSRPLLRAETDEEAETPYIEPILPRLDETVHVSSDVAHHNYADLIRLYYRNTHARTAVKVFHDLAARKLRRRLPVILRDHREDSIVRVDEIDWREGFDHLLTFYSVLELALQAGYIANPSPSIRRDALAILQDSTVRVYYEATTHSCSRSCSAFG